MDVAYERQILERLVVVLGEGRDGHADREVKTIELLPVMPIDAQFDPKSVIEKTQFPALLIHPEDSDVVEELSNGGRDTVLGVNIDVVVVADPVDLLYEYTAIGKHVIERLDYQRTLPHHPTNPAQPLSLSRVEDLKLTGASTVSREQAAATTTFTRRFAYEFKYRSSYEDIQTHDRTR